MPTRPKRNKTCAGKETLQRHNESIGLLRLPANWLLGQETIRTSNKSLRLSRQAQSLAPCVSCPRFEPRQSMNATTTMPLSDWRFKRHVRYGTSRHRFWSCYTPRQDCAPHQT